VSFYYAINTTIWILCIWFVFDTVTHFGCSHHPKCVAVSNTNQIHKIYTVVLIELLIDMECANGSITEAIIIPSEFLAVKIENGSEFLKLTARYVIQVASRHSNPVQFTCHCHHSTPCVICRKGAQTQASVLCSTRVDNTNCTGFSYSRATWQLWIKRISLISHSKE